MSNLNRANTLAVLNAALSKPGGKQAVRYVLNGLGAIPFVGGMISGSGALWSERDQEAINKLILNWATLTDAQVQMLTEAFAALTAAPTPASLAILLGELFGDQLAGQLLAQAPSQIPVVLNGGSIEELQPYVREGWVSLTSTGSVCTMGCGSRVGNHIEELKRPYGMGNGFMLRIAKV